MPPTHLIQFAFNFAVVGPIMFIPLLAQSLGASPALVGLIASVYQAMVFVSSAVFGRLADLKGHRRFIVIGLLLASGSFLAHCLIRSIPGLFLVRGLAGLTVGIFPAAVVAYATRDENVKVGRFASLGALGWGVGSIIGGLIGSYQLLFIVSSVVFFASFLLAAFKVPETHERVDQPFFSAHVLLRNWRIYVSFFLRHAGATGIWAIYPLYLQQLGATKLWIGIIYSINAFGQFAFMPWLDRYSSRRLIQLGLYGSILTFISFALCRTFWQLLPFQVLLAFSWSALYVGTLKYLLEHNPERSTAFGMLNSTLSMAGIIGAAVGGAMASLGLPVVMVGAAVMAVIGALVFRF